MLPHGIYTIPECTIVNEIDLSHAVDIVERFVVVPGVNAGDVAMPVAQTNRIRRPIRWSGQQLLSEHRKGER